MYVTTKGNGEPKYKGLAGITYRQAAGRHPTGSPAAQVINLSKSQGRYGIGTAEGRVQIRQVVICQNKQIEALR